VLVWYNPHLGTAMTCGSKLKDSKLIKLLNNIKNDCETVDLIVGAEKAVCDLISARSGNYLTAGAKTVLAGYFYRT